MSCRMKMRDDITALSKIVHRACKRSASRSKAADRSTCEEHARQEGP